MGKKPTYEELEKRVLQLEQTDIIHKQNERHLNLYKKIVDSSTDAILISTPEGQHWYQNKAFDCLFGKIENNSPVTIYCDEDVGREVYVTIMDGVEWNGEAKMYALDGQVLDILLRAYSFTDSNGKVLGLVGIHTNITKRKHIEKALHKSDDKISKIFHCSPVICGISDIDTGEYIEVNQAFYDKLGFTPEEVIGKRSSEVVHMDMLFRDRVIEKIKKQGSVKNEEAIIYTKNKKAINVLFYAEIIEIAGKKYNYATAIDITTHKELEEQLRQAQKMEAIGNLAGGIAHDFNNMLCVIIGNTSYALSKIDKNDQVYPSIQNVYKGAKKAHNLTQQLLTFAKGGAPIKKVININRLIKESARFVTRGAKTKCVYELINDLWTTEVDEGQMNQVITNIVINASQAMPDGGIIKIQTDNVDIEDGSNLHLSAGKYVKVFIKDQGVGILEKHLSKIFDPYFSTKQEGSGLGLATSYSIIKRHGGYIKVYSEPGKGTAFCIYLPAIMKDIKKAEEKKNAIHQGYGKILVMDDQHLILDVIEDILGQMGYETECTSDGNKAVEIYQEALSSEKPFDLVILDLTVPGGMGGEKTISEILKIDSKVKAIVSSGYSNDPIMATYQDYGFCGVLSKPFSMDQIAEVLKKVLSKNA